METFQQAINQLYFVKCQWGWETK